MIDKYSFDQVTVELSPNFKLSEFLRSHEIIAKQDLDLFVEQTTVSTFVLCNMLHLCASVLQPIRDAFDAPIEINSGYRCRTLNSLVGGVSTSQHLSGQAADITSSDNGKLLQIILDLHRNGALDYDQLIIYGSAYKPRFLHISYNPQRSEQRNQLLYK